MDLNPEFHHFILTYQDGPDDTEDLNRDKLLPSTFESRISLSLTTDDVMIYFRAENIEIIGVSDGVNDHLTLCVKNIPKTPQTENTIQRIVNIVYSILVGYARGMGGGEFDEWLNDFDDSHQSLP